VIYELLRAFVDVSVDGKKCIRRLMRIKEIKEFEAMVSLSTMALLTSYLAACIICRYSHNDVQFNSLERVAITR
jgi:hypothetical protein